MLELLLPIGIYMWGWVGIVGVCGELGTGGGGNWNSFSRPHCQQ